MPPSIPTGELPRGRANAMVCTPSRPCLNAVIKTEQPLLSNLYLFRQTFRWSQRRGRSSASQVRISACSTAGVLDSCTGKVQCILFVTSSWYFVVTKQSLMDFFWNLPQRNASSAARGGRKGLDASHLLNFHVVERPVNSRSTSTPVR
jgi:hypothetical protein